MESEDSVVIDLNARSDAIRKKVGNYARISKNMFETQENVQNYHEMEVVSAADRRALREVSNQPEQPQQTKTNKRGRNKKISNRKSRQRTPQMGALEEDDEEQQENENNQTTLEIRKYQECQNSTSKVVAQIQYKNSYEEPEEEQKPQIYQFQDEDTSQPEIVRQNDQEQPKGQTLKQSQHQQQGEDEQSGDQQTEIKVLGQPSANSSAQKRVQNFIVSDFGEEAEQEEEQEPQTTNQQAVKVPRQRRFQHKRELIKILQGIPQYINMRDFMNQPVRQGFVIQCTIKRQTNFISAPEYHLYMSQNYRYLASSRKSSSTGSSNHQFSVDKNNFQKNGGFYLGKLQTNFLGTKCEGYGVGMAHNKAKTQEQKRPCILSVDYETSYFGLNGPRKISVAIPEIDAATGVGKCIRQQGQLHSHPHTIKFCNKTPRYDPYLKAYVLNFNGRASLSSIKNFLIVSEDNPDRVNILFGRVAKNVFNLDVQYPFSLTQAFALAVSSFVKKLGE